MKIGCFALILGTLYFTTQKTLRKNEVLVKRESNFFLEIVNNVCYCDISLIGVVRVPFSGIGACGDLGILGLRSNAG